ncbi:ATP-binding cassette domain-containing protein [Paraburkholderia sp. 22B1P]|uniref:ABC transporter ATP-binding protein n=1 Tax=Paraburkholderia sp. 22B1P TaxID=3080498 RepID=UPI00308D8A9B|nr:ABC transporter ATP-binding protein [Paraburkholderia sp. 22B1P]
MTTGQVVAELHDVHRTFGDFVALAGVSLKLRAGEVHALLGENGAGKTTLMRVLSGMIPPTKGLLMLGGREVRLRNRQDGTARGIGMVQQHFGLVEGMTGVENFMLGNPLAQLMLNAKDARKRLRDASRDTGLKVNVEARVSDLTMGERQQLEILSALATGAHVLILDEPTAALPSEDIATLKRVIHQVRGRGTAIAYISHKLQEVVELADRVTVLRRGLVVSSFVKGEASEQRLALAMVGALPEKPVHKSKTPGNEIVNLHGVHTLGAGQGCGLKGMDFSVCAGEIVGVAGVEGNGQETLAEVLCGLLPLQAGTHRKAPGLVAYIPQDRAHDALACDLSIVDNAIVHRHGKAPIRKGLRLDQSVARAFACDIVEKAGIRTASVDIPVGALSGGNQQKLVVARELEKSPVLIVAHNPYRGLDIGAANEVRADLLNARDAGAAVVLISPDLEDLFDLCDRIVVLFHGRARGVVDPRQTTPEDVGRMLGGSTL